MKVVIAGATGFIGRSLTRYLHGRGDSVIALTRNPAKAAPILADVQLVAWSPPALEAWVDAVASADAVVNLAGEPIADKRWTPQQKRALLMSRLDSTRAIVEALGRSQSTCKTLVNASAVGYYGSRGNEILTENSSPGTDFLAELVVAWEEAAVRAQDFGVRVVLIRSAGLVLGWSGGALPRMALPFRLFGGGIMGGGDQFVSWVHIQDEVALITMALDNAAYSGPINSSSPNPVTMPVFSHALGKALHRPVWVPALPLAMRLALGERASLIFASQRVMPQRAEELGFRFSHPDLSEAFESPPPA